MPAVVAAAVAYLVPATAATAFTIAGTAVAYSTLIGYAVVVGASIAYSTSQNAKLRNSLKGLQDTGRNVMMRDPLAFQRRIYGEVPLAGPLPFMHTTGAKNEYLHVMMLIAGHEVNALNTVYFETDAGLEEVPLDGTGTNTGGAAMGKYAGFFFCNKYLGTPTQAADATMIAADGVKWTANHKFSGHAYIYLQFKYSTDIYPNGMPTVRVLTQGAKVLDPRVGITLKTCDVTQGVAHIGCATAGLNIGDLVIGSGLLPGTRIVAIDGSGTFFTVNVNPKLTNANARLAFGTDAYSANAALCVADYLADYKFGRKIPWHRINQTGLIAEANVCDESIVTDTGTEARYEIHGTCTTDQDATPDMLSAMAGRLIDTGGLWSIIAGAYHSPAFDFTDADLVGAFTTQPRQSMRESYSGVRGTFISPENAWQPADFPPVKNDTYAAQDGGLRRWKDVAYTHTKSTSCVQRLAKADMERGRQQIVIQGLFKLKAAQVQCCDTIRLTRASLGWVNKEFEVLAWSLRILKGSNNNITLAVAITARETAAAVWDWANGEETLVDLAPNTDLPSPFDVPTPTGLTLLADSTTSFIQGGDGTFVPVLRLSWNTPNNIYVESNGKTFFEIKEHASVTWNEVGSVSGSTLTIDVLGLKVGVAYDVRIYHRNEIGVRSNNGAGVATYNTVNNYTITGDTVAPNAPTVLTATVGTGKLVRLKWTLSTSPDVVQYGIFRNTANVFGGATLIGYDPGDSYNDASVVIGTTYWYWIVAYDATPNTSAPLGPATATPAYVGAGTIDPTAPSNPAGLSFTGSGTYQGGNGVQFAYVAFNLAALPSGAAGQQTLYKKTGDPQWLPFGDFTSSATNVHAIGLAMNTSYDFATVAYSSFGVESSVVSIGAIVTPNSAAPNSPTGAQWGTTAADYALIPPSYTGGAGGAKYFAGMFKWTASTSGDVDHYEVRSNNTVFYPGTYNVGKATQMPVYATLQLDVVSLDEMQVRAVNTAGVASAWVNSGSPAGKFTFNYGTQNMAEQAASGVAITGGSVTNITDLALTDGGSGSSTAAGARSNFGLGSVATQSAGAVVLTGGSATGMTTLATGNFHANDGGSGIAGGSTAVDVQGVNFRIYNGGTQSYRVDYTNGDVYIGGNRVLTARQATPVTLGDVIAVLQAHGLCS